MTKVPEGTVKSRIFNGLKRLKESFGGEYPHPQTGKFEAFGYTLEKGKVEGTLRPAAKMMDENGRVTNTFPEEMGPVCLGRPHGDLWSAWMAGGWGFYIDRKDFIPNPFEYLRKAHILARAETYGNASRIDLLSPAGEVIGTIEGDKIEAFSEIVSQMVLLSYPGGIAEGEETGRLILHLPGEQLTLKMSPLYLVENTSYFGETWLENQNYMHYQHPAQSYYAGLYEKILSLFDKDMQTNEEITVW